MLRRNSAGVVALSIAVAGLGLMFSPAARAQRGGRGGPKVADAKPGDVRILASNAVRGLLEAVRAQAEQAVGHPFLIEYGSTAGIKGEIEAGQAFEVAIVGRNVVDDLSAKGKIVAGSQYDLVKIPVAIAQRGDAPKVDISTPAAVEKALLGAKSIKWSVNSPQAPAVDNLIAKLGIAADIKDKANIAGPVQLAPGEYELNLNLSSEIVGVKGQIYLGAIPKELDIPVVMTAGVGASADVQVANALIRFLKGPAIEPSLKENALER